MNPTDNAGFELPSITSEDTENSVAGVSSAQANLDAANSQGGSNPMPIADLSQGSNSSSTTSPTNSSSALQFAQDKDLIDKEWVNKAKEIVMKNLDDPYKQSEELTLLKADYMKKRFNKTLKLSK